MVKKNKSKKRKASSKFFVLVRDYSEYTLIYPRKGYPTEKAALKSIEDDAMDNGNLGDYIIVEKVANVKVNLKVEAINKKVKK